MIKFLSVLFCIFFLSCRISGQTKEYELLDKTDSADVNSALFAMLDRTPPGMALIDNVFKPIKGKFIVYRFIATYQGISFTDEEKEFHDILVVKTDVRNKILVAYQYTLEWAEPPSETDLYVSNCKGLTLINNLSIDKFKFERFGDYDQEERKLKDSGSIKLLK